MEFTSGPDDFQFNKTIIPIRLAVFGQEKLVSRSQAKRVLTRVDKFKNVVFDFDEVETIGQAFADEIFRVYASKHKDLVLSTTNTNVQINRMIARARLTGLM